MAGICAVFGPNTEQLIKEMRGSLRQRGPDDEGFFIRKNLALGHRVLKIANIPVPSQPFANENGTIWIMVNDEIYSRKQLIEYLEETIFACVALCPWSFLP